MKSAAKGVKKGSDDRLIRRRSTGGWMLVEVLIALWVIAVLLEAIVHLLVGVREKAGAEAAEATLLEAARYVLARWPPVVDGEEALGRATDSGPGRVADSGPDGPTAGAGEAAAEGPSASEAIWAARAQAAVRQGVLEPLQAAVEREGFALKGPGHGRTAPVPTVSFTYAIGSPALWSDAHAVRAAVPVDVTLRLPVSADRPPLERRMRLWTAVVFRAWPP
ncbi:hypothetical protein [Hydrogenibacillus sp. N12]|uniref:hypothetical protein n=1 Tax=Hydrogenibacillus sp. N12 TaxID=2866627 RepID=UPI001C7D8696|nr:hypothetical protein [Hydrogenibacillus sp. N12]QZA33382.1 hypothetical protein K2M58_02210 [Hydrogenibacillus sp. N12]